MAFETLCEHMEPLAGTCIKCIKQCSKERLELYSKAHGRAVRAEARVKALEQDRDSHQRVCIREMEKRKAAEALLTPRRIDKDTPDGVLVWSAQWCQAWRIGKGDWMDLARFRCKPKWYLPMPPAPEDDA